MLTPPEAELRVAKGAAHLDQVRPGWFNEIDIGTLTLRNSCNCIIGQLNGWGDRTLKYAAPTLLPAITLDEPATRTYPAGDFPARERDYNVLQDAWIAAIADRKLKDSASWSTTPARSSKETTKS